MTGLAGGAFTRIAFDSVRVLKLLFIFGKYSRPSHTKHYRDILGPLIGSQKEYCLILRPFGSDGEIIIPHIGRIPQNGISATSTMEQVIARKCYKQLGFRTYTIVDQNRRLAPPGPVYLRASNDEWKVAAKELILRAHTIMLVVSPHQDVRESLWWELKCIVEHDLKTRMLLLLPPPSQDHAVYTNARRQTCVILAALDDYLCFNDDPVDLHGNANPTRLSDRVEYYESNLPPFLHAVQFTPSRDEDDESETTCWSIEPNKSGVLRTRATVKNYEGVIEQMLTANTRRLSKLGFSSRYPWPRGYRSAPDPDRKM